MRFQDKRELFRYNGYTPTAFDTVGDYPSALGTNLNPLGSWGNSSDNDLFQRGSFVITRISTSTPSAGGNVAPVPNAGTASQEIYVTFKSTEPLLLSPLIWGAPESNNQGFYGVQNANFVFNLGDATRVWRSANYNTSLGVLPSKANSTITAIEVFTVADSKLLFNFFTPHPSDLMPARNCVPFYELPKKSGHQSDWKQFASPISCY